MPFYSISSLFDWFQATMGSPEEPLFQKGLCRMWQLVEKFLEVEANVICTTGLQVKISRVKSSRDLTLREFDILWVLQP